MSITARRVFSCAIIYFVCAVIDIFVLVPILVTVFAPVKNCAGKTKFFTLLPPPFKSWTWTNYGKLVAISCCRLATQSDSWGHLSTGHTGCHQESRAPFGAATGPIGQRYNRGQH